MTWTASLLVLLSAFTHAGWNLLSKHEKPSIRFYLQANLAGTLCLSPFLLLFRQNLSLFPVRVWMLLLLSGFCQAIYFSSLGKGYQTGEMTVIYPMARTMPVLTIGILSIFMGQSMLTPAFFAGAALIIAGSMMLPLKNAADFSHYRRYAPLFLFAAGAAAGTTGYSLVDSRALNILSEIFRNGATDNAWQTTVLYWFFECVSTCCWLTVFYLVTGSYKKADNDGQKITPFLVGFQIVFTYFLVLMAMNFVSNVSYVAALRQSSIPIGVVLGVLLLKETAARPKIYGCLVISAGLLLVSLPL